MKKIKSLLKSNIKTIIAFIIGIIITSSTVYAAEVIFASDQVSYNNTNSGLQATTVQGALDELNDIANNSIKKRSLGDDSWDTIANNARSGLAGIYTLGSTKTVDMGSLGTHTLRVANVSTPTECYTTGFSQTACGFVLEFTDTIIQKTMHSSNTNSGGWPACQMRTYVNSDIYNSLPASLRNAIIYTTVVSGHGENNTSNFTSTDKIYLLTTHEVWEDDDGNDSSGINYYDSSYYNTRQLDYYKSIGVTYSSNSGARKNDSWWLRSPATSRGDGYGQVTYYGSWTNDYATFPFPEVSPAFRIG